MRTILRTIQAQKDLHSVLKRLDWNIKADNESELLKLTQAKMYSVVDKAKKKKIIHPNKAARHKAQIARWANNIRQNT